MKDRFSVIVSCLSNCRLGQGASVTASCVVNHWIVGCESLPRKQKHHPIMLRTTYMYFDILTRLGVDYQRDWQMDRQTESQTDGQNYDSSAVRMMQLQWPRPRLRGSCHWTLMSMDSLLKWQVVADVGLLDTFRLSSSYCCEDFVSLRFFPFPVATPIVCLRNSFVLIIIFITKKQLNILWRLEYRVVHYRFLVIFVDN